MATRNDYFEIERELTDYTCRKCDKVFGKIWATNCYVNDERERYLCTKCLNDIFW